MSHHLLGTGRVAISLVGYWTSITQDQQHQFSPSRWVSCLAWILMGRVLRPLSRDLMPDLRLPSQLRSIPALELVLNYTACWLRHVCERLAQSRCVKWNGPGVDPTTLWLQVGRHVQRLHYQDTHCCNVICCCICYLSGLQPSVKPLSVAERLMIARDAAHGLVYLHSKKCLIHMDVKR